MQLSKIRQFYRNCSSDFHTCGIPGMQTEHFPIFKCCPSFFPTSLYKKNSGKNWNILTRFDMNILSAFSTVPTVGQIQNWEPKSTCWEKCLHALKESQVEAPTAVFHIRLDGLMRKTYWKREVHRGGNKKTNKFTNMQHPTCSLLVLETWQF